MALVLAVVVLTFGMIAWFGSFSIGQLLHDKSSLLRGADAAAYSAALAQARAFNLQAYLNRAQVAHHVAMAHLVTLASAERFRSTQASQALLQNPPAVLIGMLFGQAQATAYLSATTGSASDSLALSRLEHAFSQHDDLVHDVIDQARRKQARELSHVRQQVMEQVLVRNVGQSGSAMRGDNLQALGLTLTIRHDDLPGSMQYFSSQEPAWRGLVSAATGQHGYLNPRNHVRRNTWAISARCPARRHELRRRGATTFDRQGVWRANDTLSFHAIRSNRLMGCYQREYPMGWAVYRSQPRLQTALASSPDFSELSDVPRNFSEQPFWRWVAEQADPRWNIVSGSDNRLGRLWASQTPVVWRSRGTPGYADLSGHHAHPVQVVIDVRQSASRLEPAGTFATGRPTGRFDITTLDSSESIKVASAAETYFVRPHARKDQRTERPSLFHPYWQARLTSLPDNRATSINQAPR